MATTTTLVFPSPPQLDLGTRVPDGAYGVSDTPGGDQTQYLHESPFGSTPPPLGFRVAPGDPQRPGGIPQPGQMPRFNMLTGGATAKGAGNDAFPLSNGSKGARVTQAQAALRALGYKGADGKLVAVDGVFGANTVFAVRAFHAGMARQGYGAFDYFTEPRYNTLLLEATRWRNGQRTAMLGVHPVMGNGSGSDGSTGGDTGGGSGGSGTSGTGSGLSPAMIALGLAVGVGLVFMTSDPAPTR